MTLAPPREICTTCGHPKDSILCRAKHKDDPPPTEPAHKTCDLCRKTSIDMRVREDLIVKSPTSGVLRPMCLCSVCARDSLASESFGNAIHASEFAPGQTPLWKQATLGLAFGKTPCAFVPCTDGSTQRVRLREDIGHIDDAQLDVLRDQCASSPSVPSADVLLLLDALKEARAVCQFIQTHDVSSKPTLRKAQIMAAKASHIDVKPKEKP